MTEPGEADWKMARHLAAVSSWAARDVEAIATIIATAKAEERAAVVEYLHHRANLWLNAEKVQRTEASMGVWLVCQAIERGEHRREVTDADR